MRRLEISFVLTLILACVVQARSPQGARWSEQAANEWYAKQPWLVGANYIPATAINQLEMWQADTFDPKRIDVELGWAESLGLNTMRVFLHDLLWQQDPEGFKKRVDIFLRIAQQHHIRPLFVLFDSCWDPNPHLGKQHDPVPGVHNSGWVQSPSLTALKDASQYLRLEAYVKGVVGAFAKDDRVLGWDVWNEPPNVHEGSDVASAETEKARLVQALLPRVFAWAREARPSQPLTSGVFEGGWSDWKSVPPTSKIQIEQSDILSFHTYDSPEEVQRRIESLDSYHRPVLCTEYMARSHGSTFQNTMPILKKYNVGAINWGLVVGKTQTIYPWDSWKKPYLNGEPTPWFHDILRADGRPYDAKEIEFIQDITGKRTPVIDVTDLYLPPSDWGDNFDLVTAYGLPEIDLKAVILDITQTQRESGVRDPGIIQVEQLNDIFDRNIPFATGPFAKMRSLDDQMLDAPAYQQQGINLLLQTLRESPVPVTILSFGSLRPIAVAFNRAPAVFHAKVAAIHISAGTAYADLDSVPFVEHPCVCDGPKFNREWNVDLDPLGFIRMLRSDLPIILYPCGAKGGASTLDQHDSYWQMPNLEFVHQLDSKLQSYLGFIFGDVRRLDFLRAMDFGLSDAETAAAERGFRQPHNVWETAVWMAVSGRVLVKHADGSYEIIPEKSRQSSDVTLKNDLVPCRMEVRDDANFVCTPTTAASNFRLYDRGDPISNQQALQWALPALYRSFRVPKEKESR